MNLLGLVTRGLLRLRAFASAAGLIDHIVPAQIAEISQEDRPACRTFINRYPMFQAGLEHFAALSNAFSLAQFSAVQIQGMG
jgi:hypothetical protein